MKTIVISLPPEVEPYEHDLRRFVDAMVYKLRVHAHKGKWEDYTAKDAYKMLGGEIAELGNAIRENNTVEILLESADVANYGLIISAIAIERGK